MSELRGYEDLGGDATGVEIEDAMRPDYALAEQPFAGFGGWFYRTCYDANVMGPARSIEKHKHEWRQGLNEARAKEGKPPIEWPGDVRPAPQPRSPLVLPAGAFSTVLPWTPPFDRDYLRGNSWAITMPGAPWVPGASSRHPERILSWFLDRYSLAFQDDYLTETFWRGYTHVLQSADDSMGSSDSLGNTRPPGNEQTLEQFVATCKRIVTRGLRVRVRLGSKYFSPHNMTLAQYQARFEPVMDALIAAGAVDEFDPGWEWDLWNTQTPGPVTISIFKWVGQKAHAGGCSCWIHFSPHVTQWHADGDSRGRYGFWDDLGIDVDGLNYQTRPEWSIRETQDRIVDTLHQFGEQGNRHKFRLDEDQASQQWDNDQPDEDAGDARGYLCCCTYDNVKHTDAKVWGFGNGARLPDGRPF